MSPEYISSLEISERNYIYDLLVEQLEKENKEQKAEADKANAAISKAKSSSRRGR